MKTDISSGWSWRKAAVMIVFPISSMVAHGATTLGLTGALTWMLAIAAMSDSVIGRS